MIALMPGDEAAEQIQQVRLGFAAKYQCKAALKPPVHITLIPPFHILTEQEEYLINGITNLVTGTIPFDIRLDGFGAFRRKEVIFIHVENNLELSAFQAKLAEGFQKLMPGLFTENRPYRPHVAIGYRDIPKNLFKQAADEYLSRSFELEFGADSFYLWRHDGKAWQIRNRFMFL